jgi:hypothetical protein
MNKLGTAWTGEGKGAKPKDFLAALEQFEWGGSAELLREVKDKLKNMLDFRTNLRLTGAPIRWYDLRRMLVMF